MSDQRGELVPCELFSPLPVNPMFLGAPSHVSACLPCPVTLLLRVDLAGSKCFVVQRLRGGVGRKCSESGFRELAGFQTNLEGFQSPPADCI